MNSLSVEVFWSRRAAFWLVVAAETLFLAGSNFPTPLFPIYERRFGFGSGVVTALFAVYVVALIPSMLTLGRITDRAGRKPALIGGMALSAVSSVAFAAANGRAALFAGEIIYGVAGGMVMSSAPVAIRELHPKGDVAAGALASTVAFAGGLTLGPLMSGILAMTPWPTLAPFALDVVLAVGLAGALCWIPETRPPHLTSRRRPPILHVPHEIRGDFVVTALAASTTWMATGWVFALSPSFLHEELGVRISRPVVGGLFAALLVACNGTSQLVLRGHRSSERAGRIALGSITGGLGLITLSPLIGGLPLAVGGAAAAGCGIGLVQMATMAAIQVIAPDHARGGVTSAFLTTGYLALSVPVVIAGVAADHIGLAAVTACYLGALALLVTAALSAQRTLRLREASAPATDQSVSAWR